MFRPWRTNPIWIVAALFTPMALQLVAKLLVVILTLLVVTVAAVFAARSLLRRAQ